MNRYWQKRTIRAAQIVISFELSLGTINGHFNSIVSPILNSVHLGLQACCQLNLPATKKPEGQLPGKVKNRVFFL